MISRGRRLFARGGLFFFLSLGAAVAAACAPTNDGTDSAAGAASAASDFWGDDRVGDRLARLDPNDACKIPRSYAEIEDCFGLGRKCARKDSSEVYIIEEKQARDLDGPAGASDQLFPRAVITGCNQGDRNDARTLENSYSLMTALFSPPDDTSNGDTLLLTDVEVMALDRTTGLYNFYVFGERGVTRVFRDGENVVQRTFDSATRTASAPAPAPGKRCFGCHVNGAPLMNELSDPWTNWVSFKKSFPASATLQGTTRELVTLAVPDAAKGTASLAGDLEQTLRAAHCRYVGGIDCKKGSDAPPGTQPNGFGHRILEKKEAGGVARLLRSALCETELNYVSAGQSIPLEVFFDPSAVAAASPPNVPANGDTRFPFMFPVRSEVDKDVELFLIGRRILAPSVVNAIRLVDDENDIFSADRCALHAEVTRTPLPEEGFKVNARVRDAIIARLEGPNAFAFVASQAGRVRYMKSLLGVVPGVEEEEIGRAQYVNEVLSRAKEKKTAFLEGGDAKKVIVDREAARKALARKMFAGGGPLPVLELPRQ